MRFGIVTPVVTLSPRTHAKWEQAAGADEIRTIAEHADKLGYSYLTCSEHVVIPTAALAQRGGRYYDPSATLGFIAAITTQIRLLTHVLVLPYHHPLTVAKRYGTVDQLSGGRLILGVGVGSLQPEFDLLGVPFADRGPRFEDALRALSAALGHPQPEYRGTHYEFSGFQVDPCSLQTRPPIWIGGRSARSLRRALTFADGWNPFRLDHSQLAEIIGRARATEAWQHRHQSEIPFDLVLTPQQPFTVDSKSEQAQARATVCTYRKLGATAINVRFRHRSLDHFLRLLESFRETVVSHFE